MFAVQSSPERIDYSLYLRNDDLRLEIIYIYSLKSIKGHIQNFVQQKGEMTSSSETKKGDVNNEKA